MPPVVDPLPHLEKIYIRMVPRHNATQACSFRGIHVLNPLKVMHRTFALHIKNIVEYFHFEEMYTLVVWQHSSVLDAMQHKLASSVE